MTKRQAKVVRAILDCQFKGLIPSRRELMGRLRLKGSDCVRKHLNKLERLGILERDGSGSYGNETRTLRVIWPAKNLIHPPYRVMWEMVDGRLVYAPRDVQLDHQNGNFSV